MEKIKRDLEKELLGIRHKDGFDARDLRSEKISLAVQARRLELAPSTTDLKVAQLPASVDPLFADKVTPAELRINEAEQKLATALNPRISDPLSTKKAITEEWVDLIIGFRGAMEHQRKMGSRRQERYRWIRRRLRLRLDDPRLDWL